MALLANIEDTRPRNSEHRRRIEEMYHPDVLAKEMAEENFSNLDSEHSIDDYLDTTDNLRVWARNKRKGTNLDPENRKPMQLSDSPLSDYDIQFTRLNRSVDSITPASLSSLNIPQASRTSASLSFNTPRTVATPRNSRPSSATSRKSGNFTPKLILRENQKASVDQRLSRGRFTKDFPRNFLPTTSSTPVRFEKSRQLQPKIVDKRETESIVSSTNGDAHESVEKTLISIDNQSDRTLTDENKANEPVSTSQIHESRHHDTIIPETQDVPETQDTVIPETQDVPESQDVVPETQEDEMPATQDDVANNNPVQAQVTKQNTEQQAEPRDNISVTNPRRIQSRPPIRGQSRIPTPSKRVPTTTPIAKQNPITPSHLPIAIPNPRTPRLGRTTAITPLTPIVVEDTPRKHVSEVTSSNAQNDGRTAIHHTPAGQSIQPSPVPQTVIPASNITVNVNVSNTQPQSPRQTTHTIRTHDQHIENATNCGGDNSGGNRRNSTNDSLMTNDSDSHGNEANLSDSRCETPKADKSNRSACRRLFSKDGADESRRSATFNKVDNIDNMTRTIPGESSSTQFRTRSKNNITYTGAKSPSVIAPGSQTFVKPKVSLQNATYDVSAENQSIRTAVDNHRSNVGINTEEFIAMTSMERTNNENGSTFNSLPDLPSEVHLDPIDVSDDEVNADEADNVDNLNDESNHHAKQSRNRQKRHEEQKTQSIDYNSARWNPMVSLHRIPTKVATPQQKNPKISMFRASQSYSDIPPPDRFRNSPKESLPAQTVVEKRISKIRESLHGEQNQSVAQTKQKRKSKRRTEPDNEDLNIVKQNLEKLSNKPPSEKPKPRRLRSMDDIHVNDDDNGEPIIETSNQNQSQSTTTTNESVFKKPNAPAPRKSRTTKANESNSADKSATGMDGSQDQEELVVTVDIQPLDVADDDVEINNHAEDNEPTSSNQMVQRDASPPVAISSSSQKQKKKTQPKVRASATKKPSRSKSKTKETESTPQEDGPSNDVTSSESTERRPRRDRKPVHSYMHLLQTGLTGMTGMNSTTSTKAEKRKSRPHAAHRTEPVVPIRNDPEIEPPRKKLRAQSEIAHPITRPSSSKSVKSLNSGSRPSKFDKTMGQNTENGVNRIASFTQNFKGYIKKKSQQKEQWWKDLLNINEKGPIYHSVNEVDCEYINTQNGSMEITFADKIEYGESQDVQFGFVPTFDKRFGIMRFKPKAIKALIKNEGELELHILRGEFIIHNEDEELEAFAGTDLTIPKNVSYGIVNNSDDVGIIQFAYAASPNNDE